MLKSSGFGIALFINIIIVVLWNFLSYFISTLLPKKYIHDSRPPFRIRDFEHQGKFYEENFACDKWYRSLPGRPIRWRLKDNMFERKTIPDLQKMVLATCRIELWSMLNCTYFLCAWILDAAYLAFILSSIVFIANIPYIICSRYARCMILNAMVGKRREQAKKAKEKKDTPNFMDMYFSL
ncbi:MAG: hypothetical protein IIY78_04325 [Clostridia bacterium]|nr:hypothetical protein [Clostridia bacterium]